MCQVVILTILRFLASEFLDRGPHTFAERVGRSPCSTREGWVMDGFDDADFGLFADLDLGDQRRSNRLNDLVDSMRRHPGGSLPTKLPKPADLRAFYRLMDCAAVTHSNINGSSRRAFFSGPASTASKPTSSTRVLRTFLPAASSPQKKLVAFTPS